MRTVCPICDRELSDAEFLLVTNDQIGSIIVWHMIPKMKDNGKQFRADAAVGYVSDLRPYFDTPYADNVLPDDLSTNEYHSFCGNAGYRGFTTE